jgi:methylenetetrahydrofolate dehydrogenase (NADP+)/methenyltetrahydrofolate cyclohydrolase
MILDGKKIQEKRIEVLKNKISKLEQKPALVIIQIGENKESDLYIKKKIEFGKKIGVTVESYQLEENVKFEFIEKLIGDFNNDSEIGGIIVQLPLPKKFDPEKSGDHGASKRKILNLIDPEKDIDGLRSDSKFLPATTKGIITLLEEYEVSIKNKKVVVIGDSDLVGKPTVKAFDDLGADVEVCNEFTENIQEKTKKAEIIISATGQPGLVTKDFVSKGQTIVDVGTTFVDGKLKGDVDFEEVSKIVENITPVPGGVGPMTVLSLFENLVLFK